MFRRANQPAGSLLIDRAVNSVIEKCMTPGGFAVMSAISVAVAVLGVWACSAYAEYELENPVDGDMKKSSFRK